MHGGAGYTGFRVCVVCEEMLTTGKLEGKGVGLDTSSKDFSSILLGMATGLMASCCQATTKIKRFLEI